VLVDIDHFEDAVSVAALIPSSDLAIEVDRVSSRLGVMA
jgi:hypothetical protein